MTEDEENENEEKKVEHTSGKTLLELEQESLRKLEQFVDITWQPRPNKGTVRIWIDDGTFKMTMKNEKFIEILESILLKDEEHPMYQTYYNLKNIENSLNQYQGFYQYNREKDEYRALRQLRLNDKMSKNELYEESRKDYENKMNSKNRLNDLNINGLDFDIYNKIAGQSIKNDKKKSMLENSARFYGGF